MIVMFEFLTFPLFIDTLLFQIGPLVQKIWCFKVGPLLIFSKFSKNLPPISQKPIVQSTKNFRSEVWGRNQHVCQISLKSKKVGVSPLGELTWNDTLALGPNCKIIVFRSSS